MSKLMSMLSGRPVVECDNNDVHCCVTDTISDSSDSSNGSRVPFHSTADMNGDKHEGRDCK